MAAARRQPAAGAGRLFGRLGRGGRGARSAGGDRHRYRRLDPPAGELLRHRRSEADLWPLFALGHRRLCFVARSGRADDTQRARRGADAEIDGRPRSEGFDLGQCAGAGFRESADRRYPRHEDRHSARIPHRRHAGGDRGAVAARHRVAETSGRDAGRGQLEAHQIRAAGLLHHRAGGSFVQSRAL